MGRAMIIICAGLLVSMGYVGFGTNQQMKQVVGKNASYAETVQAKNAAHTAIQMAMNEIDQDDAWTDDHDSEANARVFDIDGISVKVYIDEMIYDKDEDSNSSFFDPDTLRIASIADYFDPVSELERTTNVVSVYKTNAIDEYVPNFEGALTFTGEADVSTNGSASLSGNDASGTCEDKPAIATYSEEMKEHTEQNTSSIDVEGGVAVKEDLNYDPTSEMIARIMNSGNYTEVSGTYKGDFGTADDPGVYIVDGNAKLTGGIPDGHGILIIRSDASMEMEDSELSVAGEFTFNGLVVFENAYNLKGRGTPTINGSVLVGNTDDYTGDPLSVDLNGNIHLQYDCQAEEYAKAAAANAVARDRFRRISTYE